MLKTDAGVSKGKKFSKMGMRGSPTGEIFFENVKLGEDRILGKFGRGKEIILSGLNSERIILSFIFVGLLKRAIELSLKYANERKQFGQNLGEFEMIQEKIAYMYTKFRTSKLLCDYALESLKSSNMNAIDAAAGFRKSRTGI